ncbi:MAG: metal ABC transporter permease [Sulfuritalea sp.]|nr:metal ABC transporter permease [Sulfuritalea sp.]MDP1982253.1 metal ABC transporter permease [Sulfuritalea sp.]
MSAGVQELAGLQGLDWGLLAAPFAAGLLVLATHVVLGIDVLRRGIIFIDLAIAQVAGLGAIAASLTDLDAIFHDFGPPGIGVQVGAQLAAALAAGIGALLLTWCERRWPDIQEALIGLVFVFAAAAGILLLARHPQGGEHLRDLLAGQLLWVNWRQLLPVAVLYIGVLALWFGPAQRWPRLGFYLLFAITVTASVQLVGVLLVFASLIAPAVATRAFSGGRRIVIGYLAGAVGYAMGLGLSLYADLPAGATVVCCLCLTAIAGLGCFRREGRGLY